MKNTTTLLAALVTSLATAQGTVIQRTDMSCGSETYYTTAVLLDCGWEMWAFGTNRRELLDLEVGRLYPVGKDWLIGGYAVYWPETKKWFAVPAVTYNNRVGNGQLNLNLAAYIPLNGGPWVLFCDESSLVWQNKAGQGLGLVASYWKFDKDPATFRLGPTIRFPLGKANFKLNYQPWFLAGNGPAAWRVELGVRF